MYWRLKILFLCVLAIKTCQCENATAEARSPLALPPLLRHFNATCQKSIKCPPTDNPVCVRIKYVTPAMANKTIYILMVNKCEMEYLRCYNDIRASVMPLKYCDHGNKGLEKTVELEKLQRKELEDELREEFKKVEIEFKRINDSVITNQVNVNATTTPNTVIRVKRTPAEKTEKAEKAEESAEDDASGGGDDSASKADKPAGGSGEAGAAKAETPEADANPPVVIVPKAAKKSKKKAEEEPSGESESASDGLSDDDKNLNPVRMTVLENANHASVNRRKRAVSVPAFAYRGPERNENMRSLRNRNKKRRKHLKMEKNRRQKRQLQLLTGSTPVFVEGDVMGRSKRSANLTVKNDTNEVIYYTTEYTVKILGPSDGLNVTANNTHPLRNKNDLREKVQMFATTMFGGEYGGTKPEEPEEENEDSAEVAAKLQEQERFQNKKKWGEEKFSYSCSDMPKCPIRDVMVCARCTDNIYRTFHSVCHMRRFMCKYPHEKLTLVSRFPCAMSAPYHGEALNGTLAGAWDDDAVHRYKWCLALPDRMNPKSLTYDARCKGIELTNEQLQEEEDFKSNYPSGNKDQAIKFYQEKNVHRAQDLTNDNVVALAELSDMDHFETVLKEILIPRVVGTPTHLKVQFFLINEMASLGWSVEEDAFTDTTPTFGKLIFKNIIAKLNPNAERYLVLACHYDSQYTEEYTFVGATDSAVPCAMMINLAKVLSEKLDRLKRERLSLMFIFFDGEEAFKEWGPNDSIYGARNLAKRWHKEKYKDGANQLQRMDMIMLLDLLGAPDPVFYSFFQSTDKWYMRLVAAEKRLEKLGQLQGYGGQEQAYFSMERVSSKLPRKGVFVEDDHVPFMKRNVNILHIIAAPFPSVWHTAGDDRSALDYNTIGNLNKIFCIFLAEYLHLDL